MASITAGAEQPCNHECAYPEGAPARRQSAAGAVGRGEPLPWLPTAVQELCHTARQPSAGSRSGLQSILRGGSQRSPGLVPGAAGPHGCLRATLKKTANRSGVISYELDHGFPRCFWPPESWQPSSFWGPCFHFHPLVIITFNYSCFSTCLGRGTDKIWCWWCILWFFNDSFPVSPAHPFAGKGTLFVSVNGEHDRFLVLMATGLWSFL